CRVYTLLEVDLSTFAYYVTCHDLFYFFSIAFAPPPQALHSFPTRRSSDLANLPMKTWSPWHVHFGAAHYVAHAVPLDTDTVQPGDRKSTRLNSSHVSISYAVFCLKKKKHTVKAYNKESTETETAASHYSSP